MNLKKRLFIITAVLILFVPCVSSGQNSGFSGGIELGGYYSGRDPLPFWMYQNQRGRVLPNTNFNGLLSGQYVVDVGRTGKLSIGGSLLFLDELEDKFYIDEAFLQYQDYAIRISAGRKHQKEHYRGISSANDNILWSLNAPAPSGIELGTNGIYFFDYDKRWGVEALWADYLLEENRYVQQARLHRKYVRLVYQPSFNWQIQVGLQHFAQWGGTSLFGRKQPSGLKDYFKIITARPGDHDAVPSDQTSVLGNHLGSWELYVTRKFRDYKVKLIYNSIFEDGSGNRLANFPDGRYGIYFEKNDKDQLVNALIYEFIYTRHQSHDVNIYGPDRYLEHNTYRSGWTYQNRILAVPFFSLDRELGLITNSKYTAHHFGLSGQFSTYWENFPYKFLFSYIHKEGTFSRGIIPNNDVYHLYTDFRLLNKPFELNVLLSASYGSNQEAVYGAGINFKKSF